MDSNSSIQLLSKTLSISKSLAKHIESAASQFACHNTTLYHQFLNEVVYLYRMHDYERDICRLIVDVTCPLTPHIQTQTNKTVIQRRKKRVLKPCPLCGGILFSYAKQIRGLDEGASIITECRAKHCNYKQTEL